ncbi:hypothetical protein E2493_16515 [Sphingomonas parva]|uniref:Uncharacterized protein n=1 Tax=Sphingomonas parva TaxID=2555898 RepID=A0A4Y8ZMD9_9SPHN|nr:hypothetical protein [Sphingomonas parva]TFI57183.1 hypothetical protein E2493_16515 [Sphingomonas parva]
MARSGLLTRVSGLGGSAALAALLLWPFLRRYGEALLWPFGLVAALAGLCGVIILIATAADMARRRRGAAIRPVRGFDIVFGAGLVLLSLLQLSDVRGQLPF